MPPLLLNSLIDCGVGSGVMVSRTNIQSEAGLLIHGVGMVFLLIENFPLPEKMIPSQATSIAKHVAHISHKDQRL